MDQTLVLNASYEPLRVVPWQKAITLLFQGKVEVIAVYDREIRGVTVRVRLPSVLRLLRHVRMKRTFTDVPFSRANVYGRDDQLRLVKEAMRRLGIPSDRLSPAGVHATIGRAKNALKTARAFSDSADNFAAKRVAEVYTEY